MILFGRLLSRIEGRVTLVAGREKAELLAGLGAADRAADFDSLPMHEVFSDAPLEACSLTALLGGHDRLISCFAAGDRRAELRLAALAGVSQAAFLPVRPAENSQAHLLEIWSDMLGLAPPEVSPARWEVPEQWRRAGAAALDREGVDSDKPYAVIHPGAGSAAKCWRLERFCELADGIIQSGCQVGFVLGPVESERWGAEAIAKLRSNFATLVSPPLPVLAGVLAAAAAYVGNDSGVSHLSAALGAATVALFATAAARHFAPVGAKVSIVAAPTLESITTEQVLGVLTHIFREP